MKEYDNYYISTSFGNNPTMYENIIKKAIEKNIKIIGISYEAITSNELTPSSTDDFKNVIKNAKKENFEGFNSTNTSFNFGSASIKFFNWEIFDENGKQIYSEQLSKREREVVEGENNNSLAVLLTQGSKKALFAGDMNNLDKNEETGRIGDEDRIKYDVGDIDFLKLGHHGYANSNTTDYINVIKPEYAMITNDEGKSYKDNIHWLDENAVEYFYTTQDDFGMDVTFTNNDIYFSFETFNRCYKLGEQVYYIPDDSKEKNYKDYLYKVKYNEKNITVSSWEDLKNVIDENKNEYILDKNDKECYLDKLIINLDNTNFVANSSITIEEYQDITLTTSKDVKILRDLSLISEPLFFTNGVLNLGTSKMSGNITIDGNKENVKATSNLIYIQNGTLNMYDNTTLCNNLNNIVKKVTTSGVTNYYTAYGSAIHCSNGVINMYGGEIKGNQLDNNAKVTIPEKYQSNYNFDVYGAGIFINNFSVFNMYGGKIINNSEENHSFVQSKSTYSFNLSSGNISQNCYGSGIYASNATINLLGGEISNNTINNYSKITFTSSTVENMKTSAKNLKLHAIAAGIYTNDSKVNIKNNFLFNNNNSTTSVNINLGKDTVFNAVQYYCSGMQGWFTSSDIKIDGMIAKNSYFTDNSVLNNDGAKIGSEGTSKPTDSRNGGGFYFNACNYDINNITIDNCKANSGGALVLASGKGKINNSTFSNNTALKNGGGIYLSNENGTIISNSKIINNSANIGGGIYINNTNSNIELDNIEISGNKATTSSGGGIYAYGTLTINGNKTKITDNEASTYGGGLMIKTKAIVNNGLFENNKALKNNGGGIKVDSKAFLVLNNGKIKNNYAKTNGGGIEYVKASNIDVKGGTVKYNKADQNGDDIYPVNEELLSKLSIEYFYIDIVNGNGGKVEPSTNEVKSGDSQTYTFTPNSGYQIKNVIIDGTDKGSIKEYKFEKVNTDHKIEVNFEKIKSSSGGSSGSSGGGGGSSSSSKYKITTKTTNATITPSVDSVKKNSDQEFRFIPDKGYEITDVLLDGKSLGAISSYTLTNVTSKHTIEVKTQKIKEETSSNDENDIIKVEWKNADDWAIKELEAANNTGLIPETLENKDFTEKITRLDFAAIAVKLYERLSGNIAIEAENNPFKDTDDSYVLKAYSLGITLGTSEDTFSSDSNIKREEMATMIRRAISKAGINTSIDVDNVPKFDDDNEISEWSKISVYYLSSKGIVKGVGDNTFNSKGNTKIEEAILIALRSVNEL